MQTAAKVHKMEKNKTAINYLIKQKKNKKKQKKN